MPSTLIKAGGHTNAMAHDGSSPRGCQVDDGRQVVGLGLGVCAHRAQQWGSRDSDRASGSSHRRELLIGFLQ